MPLDQPCLQHAKLQQDGRWFVQTLMLDGGSVERAFVTEQQADDELDRINSLPRCRECGGPADAGHLAISRQIEAAGVCWVCWFWRTTVEDVRLAPERAFCCQHELYWLGDEGDEGMRGFGGRCFTIERRDGTRVETTNLWHGGRVPPCFWDRLPDDARFVGQEPPGRYGA